MPQGQAPHDQTSPFDPNDETLEIDEHESYSKKQPIAEYIRFINKTRNTYNYECLICKKVN